MKNIVRALVTGFVIAVAAALVLLLIFAFAANNSQDSMAGVGLYGRITFFVSVFAGCMTAAKLAEKSPMSLCLIFCFIYVLICFLLLLVIGGNVEGAWITYLGAFAIAVAGGFLGSIKKPKKPKSFKNYKKYMRK